MSPFMSRAINTGLEWISDKYRGHPKHAIEAAQRNSFNFFGHVNIRLEGLKGIEGFEEKTRQALADPDFTCLFQQAVLGAARINSDEKHKLLANLITNRLNAKPDSMNSLAAYMACNAVPQLSNLHLRLLGALYIIRRYPIPSYIEKMSYDERIDIGTKWFLNEIAHFIPIGKITDLDFAHLTATSCITFVPQMIHPGIGGGLEPGYWRLSVAVRDKFFSKDEIFDLPHNIKMPRIDQDNIGKDLLSSWENSDMKKASLTSAGCLIGMYVQDIVSSEEPDLC